jgi:sarcosine oxidase, subunit gamma
MLKDRSIARRIGILDHVERPPLSPSFGLQVLAPEVRFTLRVAASDAAHIGRIGHARLPLDINRSVQNGGQIAARLGPDEWWLSAPEGEAEAIHASASSALAGRNFALVDISHRNVGFEVTGHKAAVVINAGCPLDLGGRQFEPGAATRTLLGKVEIVLFRLDDGVDSDGQSVARYRIECWRSFGRYLHEFLVMAADEHAVV